MVEESDSAIDIDRQELEFRRRWHRAHIDRFDVSATGDQRNWRARRITPHADEARQYLDAMRRTGDLSAFQLGTDKWMRNFDSGYSGTAGQMIVNQINKISVDREQSVSVLLDALTTPSDREDAIRKIRLLADHLQSIQVGAHPSPKRAPFVASYYWGMDSPGSWPVAWPKSSSYLAFQTGITDYEDQGERYDELYQFAHEIDGDPRRFEQVAAWWADSRPVILDEVLCDRARLREDVDKQSESPTDYLANARVLVAASQHIGDVLSEQVSKAAGRTLKAHKPSVMWTRDFPRGDLWADWKVPDTYGLGIRLWLNSRGVAIGLRPYPDAESGATDRAVSTITKHSVPTYEILAGGRSTVGRDVGFRGGGSGEVMYGRWFESSSLDSLDVPGEVVRAAREVAPLISEFTVDVPADDTDELAELVSTFRRSTNYPTPGHEQDQADRKLFAKWLAPEELEVADKRDLRQIWNTQRYGGTGPMPGLNISVRDADDVEYHRILHSIRYLCWGDDPPATRIDRVLTSDELRVKGLGESVIMKMLAICDPERFITVYPYRGSQGKLKMLKILDLPAPTTGTPGELQVAANDALRARIDRYFPGDALGVGAFLYWLLERNEEPEPEPVDDPLDDLADELLVDREFVHEVVELLEDKRQVVFYGPPGTGKTYFARKLAEVLAPDPERRPVVQFHPSTSYEDFFEGYRPETDSGGSMTYRLQRGPLAELAARAGDAPGKRHVMIIDEINRANLPKVLGEMLFLFENRDTPIRTLYRPEDPFSLSQDIWFIGTMNTADRSIALIDAALRRRFHFVPFFPGHGPMKGLLGRWLEREGEPTWVGDLVEQVNAELAVELGGPHLQLGPSHFMKKSLDTTSLRRIWRYNIEPFIEDQFFGDTERIEKFRFESVYARFVDLAGEEISEEAEDRGRAE